MRSRSDIPQAAGCPDVTISINGKSYRLALKAALWADKRTKFVPLDIKVDAPNSLGRAQARQLELQQEIYSGQFDPTLSKYRSWKYGIKYSANKLTLTDLWEFWCIYKKPLIAASTYKQKFRGTYLNCLYAIDGSNLELSPHNAIKLRNWLLENRNKQDSVNFLNELENATIRAINVGLHKNNNPFLGMANSLKESRDKKIDKRKSDEIIADLNEAISYSLEEANNIIEYFKIKHPHYWRFVYFRFYTGMRLGESIELRWEDLSEDYSKILIRRAYDSITKDIKATKTGKSRIFNCSESLQEWLISYRESLPPFRSDKNSLLFVNSSNNRINTRSFLDTWDRAISALLEKGLVSVALSPKNSRHSFVTIARLSGIDPSIVAAQVGHSKRTEDTYYLDNPKNDVIDFG